MISIDIKQTLQSAQGNLVLNVKFEVPKGEIVTLYGESGAGKTTILKVIAGLLKPEEGLIKMGENVWLDTNKKINFTPQKRSIGFVFQYYALFPNMSVKENLEFAVEKVTDKQNVNELIEVMELQQLQNRKTETLSGGQKQRVALARALVRKPKLLLLDEPLSALHNEMRLKLQEHILMMHKAYELTTILVSHDLAEIYKMSDRIMFLKDGKLVENNIPSHFSTQNLSDSNFKMIGEVLKIEKQGSICKVSVLILNSIIIIAIEPNNPKDLKPGDKVVVFSPNFTPEIMKLEL